MKFTASGLGFSIPINVFGPGLRINHYGLIVVNPKARVGAFCDIHQGVNIGEGFGKDDVPEIGDRVYIGLGEPRFTAGSGLPTGPPSAPMPS